MSGKILRPNEELSIPPDLAIQQAYQQGIQAGQAAMVNELVGNLLLTALPKVMEEEKVANAAKIGQLAVDIAWATVDALAKTAKARFDKDEEKRKKLEEKQEKASKKGKK